MKKKDFPIYHELGKIILTEVNITKETMRVNLIIFIGINVLPRSF